MSEGGKAVFLSYASQDSEAAKKICDALRSSGVEVWFDAEGGLEHGDEWDAKIRKQIKECVLFIPVISANTQAREEGYFRIEWDLAAERARGIASGVAFILPVVVDDTREPEALVPDRFRMVQWTRLRGGELTSEVKQRFLKLWSHRAGVVKHTTENRGQKTEDGRLIAQAAAGKPGMKTYALLAAGVAVLVALIGWWFMRGGKASSRPAGGLNAEPAAAKAGARIWPKDPELRRAIGLVDSLEATLEDYRLADEITTRALEKSPTDPETVTVAARVNNAFLVRNFDFRPERSAAAKRLGERAIQLSPDDPEAYYSLSIFLLERAGESARAEALARRACELAPDDPKNWRQLVRCMAAQRPDEALALAEKNVERFPRDVLTHYELSIIYRSRRDWAKFERETEATIALNPLPNAINWRARAAFRRGELPEVKAWLDRVPARARAEERTVVTSFIYALLSGDYDYGLKALQSFAEPWFNDTFNYSGPAALPQAELLAQQGKTALARQQYEAALAELHRHQAANPADLTGRETEFWILLGLGRTDEARAAGQANFEALPRPYQIRVMTGWWFDPIPSRLLAGDREGALQLIRETVTNSEGRHVIQHYLPTDPRLKQWRDDPEIKALLAEPAGTAPVATTSSKELSPARKLAEQARDLINALETTREDFALADDLCQRALKLDPTDGEVWAVASQLDAAFSYRGWDNSPERREQMRVRAERAIRLAPNSPTAKLAQAGAWRQFRINAAETEKLIREALEQRPDDKRAWGFLAAVLLSQGRVEESIAINDRTAAMPGGDPLGLFNKSRTLEQVDRLEEAYAAAQAAVAQKPFASALVQLMRLEINWRGDLNAAAATLARLPASELLEDRASYTTGLLHFYRRDPEAALAVWRTFPRDFIDDPMFRGPKGLLVGEAHRMAGHTEAAQLEWRTALQVVEKRLAATPGDVVLLRSKIILQAYLADPAAGDTWRLFEQLAGLKFTADRPMTAPQALVLLALGRKEEVLAQLPASIARPGRSNLSAAVLRLDPYYDPVRDDPRFVQLLEKNPLPEAKR